MVRDEGLEYSFLCVYYVWLLHVIVGISMQFGVFSDSCLYWLYVVDCKKCGQACGQTT